MSDDFDTATRYLRGELDDLDRAVFEERVLADEAVHQTVVAAEDELLDAHVAGTLDGEVGARLERRLAVEPGLRRRLALARGLFGHAARVNVAAPRSAPVPRTWLRWAVPLAIAAAAAAVVMLVMLRSPPPRPEVVSLTMSAPTRGSVVPELRLPSGTRTVRLLLAAPSTPGPRVSVSGPGGAVAPIRTTPSPDGLVLELEAAALGPGLYDVTVTAAGGPVVTFQLRVIR